MNLYAERGSVVEEDLVEFRPNDVPCRVFGPQSDKIRIYVAFRSSANLEMRWKPTSFLIILIELDCGSRL